MSIIWGYDSTTCDIVASNGISDWSVVFEITDAGDGGYTGIFALPGQCSIDITYTYVGPGLNNTNVAAIGFQVTPQAPFSEGIVVVTVCYVGSKTPDIIIHKPDSLDSYLPASARLRG